MYVQIGLELLGSGRTRPRVIGFPNATVGYRASERLVTPMLKADERIWLRRRFQEMKVFPGLVDAIDRIEARGGMIDPANVAENLVVEIAANYRAGRRKEA